MNDPARRDGEPRRTRDDAGRAWKIRKPRKRVVEPTLDLRTPSGRVLPY
ncbi:hypothetical protein [Sphaerisporangium fuscum]|nr:hypothetical protein [Sphaerisporangium fuscum]